jgi:hypothetical protein
LLDQLTSVQISEWEAYDRLDPIGTWRDDFRMANLVTTMTNLTISVHGRKGTKMVTPINFMPEWDVNKVKEVKIQSVEEMKEILVELADIQNAKFRRENVIDMGRVPRLTSKTKGL